MCLKGNQPCCFGRGGWRRVNPFHTESIVYTMVRFSTDYRHDGDILSRRRAHCTSAPPCVQAKLGGVLITFKTRLRRGAR